MIIHRKEIGVAENTYLEPWVKGKIKNIDNAEFDHKKGKSGKSSYRSEYSKLGTEEKRMKYLGWRDSLMARHIVART